MFTQTKISIIIPAIPFLVLVTLIFLFLPNSAFCQREAMKALAKPSIASIHDAQGNKLDEIVLKRGDRPMIIVVNGRNLHLVKKAQLFGKQRVGQKHVAIKVLAAKPTQLRLSLQIKTTTFQGAGFYLQLQDIKQNRLADAKIIRISLGARSATVAVKPTSPSPAKGKTTQPRVPSTQKSRRPVTGKTPVTSTPPRGSRTAVITSTNKNSLQLKPGKTAEVILTGKNLAQIIKAQVTLNGQVVGSVQTRLGPVLQNGSSRKVFLSCPRGMKLKKGKYKLSVTTAEKKMIAIPAELYLQPSTSVAGSVANASVDPDSFFVTRISPDQGERGSTVVLYGNGFQQWPVLHVDFSRWDGAMLERAAITNKTNTSLTLIVPSRTGTGPLSIRADDGSSGMYEAMIRPTDFEFTLLQPPSITEFSPTSGPVGMTVRVEGYNFIPGRMFKFYNNIDARPGTGPSGYTEGSPLGPTHYTHISVPPYAETGPITILTSEGSYTTTSDFTVEETTVENMPPAISQFTPNHGATGTEVTFTGRFDETVGNNEFLFGPTRASAFPTTGDATSVKVLVPTSAGTGQIAVRNQYGETRSANIFYLPPSIDHLNYDSGPEGFVIRIYGENLDFYVKTNNWVKFNGVIATVRNVNQYSKYIEVAVPSGATSGPVTVETPGGIATSPNNFTVISN